MADNSGKFEYLGADGGVAQQGACRVHFDQQNFTLTPDSGAPLIFDLGDVDAVAAADYEIKLPLYTGRTLRLRQFGKAYETLAHDLIEAYRKRMIQCMLLEDLEEVDRFTGNFELAANAQPGRSGAAEFRLYKSNLAVLPQLSQAFQWRLADVDLINADPANYRITLQSGNDRLIVSRLAKRTEEFANKLHDAADALASQSAEALHGLFPFLNPDQLQAASSLWREGRSARISDLAAIDKRIPTALKANAVDANLSPYHEYLLNHSAANNVFAGFKMIRPEDQDASGDAATIDPSSIEDATGDADSGSSTDSVPKGRVRSLDANLGSPGAVDADEATPQALYWFFFPLAVKAGSSQPANLVAWEASSRSGRATYFFRMVDSDQARQLEDNSKAAELIEAAIRRLSRTLGLLNFRRRPIYLSDDALETNPIFRRYAIAARRLPELRQVRASLIGRAIHTSFETWQAQVDSILAKSET